MFAPKFAPLVGSAAVLVLGAGAAGAQFTTSGANCAGESGTPASISADGFPTVGGSGYTVTVTGAPSTPVLLGVALNPIPAFPLDGVGLPGCFLHTVPVVTLSGSTDVAGELVINAPAPVMAGMTTVAQGYVADFGPSTLGATTELLTYTTLPPSAFSGGEVIVTEFMRDTVTIGDGDGEWIEIYNTTGAPIDIEGWYLADDDFDQHQIDVGGAGLTIAAGGYLTLGIGADPLVSGLTPDYVYSGVFLSNSSAGDEILLLDPVGFEVDRLEYSSPAWPLLGGASASLDPASLDGTLNDDPLNWCLNSSDVYETVAGVNTGTPGVVNPTCTIVPSGEIGDIIITEVMQNPSALGDADGEYFEVYNTTGAAIDMMGWTVSDLGSDSFVVGSSVIVPAGGYATFSNGAAPGFASDYVYGTAMALANGDDELVLTDTLSQKQDEIFWDNGATFPDPNGSSMNFSAGVTQDAATNNDGTNWCAASTAGAGYTSGDNGSPGTANEVCP